MALILVVEPDDAVAADLARSLTVGNNEIVLTKSGDEALVWTTENGSPDIAVVDVELPDLEPTTLVAALGVKVGSQMPTFFVSRRRDLSGRFNGAPVLLAPFDPMAARAVLAETMIEWDMHHG